MEQDILTLAKQLRHELHRHPELSLHETGTKGRLMEFLRSNTRLKVVDMGQWFYALYSAGEGSPSVAFRADLDALPIQEPTGLVPYASENIGVSHKCGHDGHSAALAALAMELERRPVDKHVYLIFQHAEEIGKGGIPCADFLRQQGIDEVYAFHNLPGLPLGAVAAPEGVAQFASTGMILRFKGQESHASYPEKGRNPAFAIAELISALPALTIAERWQGMTLITVIQVQVGDRAFGVSAGSGQLLLTVRGEFEAEMDALLAELKTMARQKAESHGLTVEIEYDDRFPETRNHPEATAKILRCAAELGIPTAEMSERFRASEDFGYFTKAAKGAIFYIGTGDGPALHTPEYNFPDELLPIAADLFHRLAED